MSVLQLASTPETVVWGVIPADRAPVLNIQSGDTVRIDTVSHQGITRGDPVPYFGAAGISSHEVLDDAKAIYARVKRAVGGGVHVLTGPLYIEGAQPGDLLEVRVRQVEFRVPYGANTSGPDFGVLPHLLSDPVSKVIRIDVPRKRALFSSAVEIPVNPFMGIMAVAPPADVAPVSTKPPGPWGGNMDMRHLVAGATLYLPVFHEGALFYVGDGHATQGDGEVDGTAIEISLTPTLEFHVHKGAGSALKWPRAEDADHHYIFGMDADLQGALRNAVHETVQFLEQRASLSPAEAYALASLAVDFRIGEAVNLTQLVYGMVPKNLFRERSTYWNTGQSDQ